uniref:Uncharacterized protein n=1 Tax=Setaria digitata TaxID=48799 RepID=A0A915PNY2_9BILA
MLLSLFIVVTHTTPLENPELAKKLLQAIPRFKRQVGPFNGCGRCCCCLRCCCCQQPVVVPRCCQITRRICCQLSSTCCNRINQTVVPQQLVPLPIPVIGNQILTPQQIVPGPLPIPAIGQGVGIQQLLPQILSPIQQVPSLLKGSVCCSCFGIGHGSGRRRNSPAFIQ